MSRSVRVVAVSAGLSQPSSTRLLTDRLVTATRAALGSYGVEVDVEVVELRDLAHDLTDRLLTGFGSDRLEAVLSSVASADALIAVTPVFSASYSGLFKTFVDVIDTDALDGTPVLVGATAGTARHSLVLEHALRPLFSYLHAVVVPTGVFAASEDFGATADGALSTRVDRAARELAALVSGAARERRPRQADAFDPDAAGFASFEDLLAR
ncbi:MAG: FMN reductase [Nocardioides sp.]